MANTESSNDRWTLFRWRIDDAGHDRVSHSASRPARPGRRPVRAHPRPHAHPRCAGRGAPPRGRGLDAYWIGTDDVPASCLEHFDGIWVVPGGPYRSEDGALAAIRTAREHRIPFLGTCGGFQHAMLEYARHVCGLTTVQHAENNPAAEDFLIVPLACSMFGHERTVLIAPDSRAARALGGDRSRERYHCSYTLNASYQDVLTALGVCLTGHDTDGTLRIAELPEHPFYLATLFQPELADKDTSPHPLISAFAAAVVHHHGRTIAAPEPLAGEPA